MVRSVLCRSFSSQIHGRWVLMILVQRRTVPLSAKPWKDPGRQMQLSYLNSAYCSSVLLPVACNWRGYGVSIKVPEVGLAMSHASHGSTCLHQVTGNWFPRWPCFCRKTTGFALGKHFVFSAPGSLSNSLEQRAPVREWSQIDTSFVMLNLFKELNEGAYESGIWSCMHVCRRFQDAPEEGYDCTEHIRQNFPCAGQHAKWSN